MQLTRHKYEVVEDGFGYADIDKYSLDKHAQDITPHNESRYNLITVKQRWTLLYNIWGEKQARFFAVHTLTCRPFIAFQNLLLNTQNSSVEALEKMNLSQTMNKWVIGSIGEQYGCPTGTPSTQNRNKQGESGSHYRMLEEGVNDDDRKPFNKMEKDTLLSNQSMKEWIPNVSIVLSKKAHFPL